MSDEEVRSAVSDTLAGIVVPLEAEAERLQAALDADEANATASVTYGRLSGIYLALALVHQQFDTVNG